MGIPNWVMKYNELLAAYDAKANKVMLIEDYGPKNGFFIEAWRAIQFPRTSSLVEKSFREGSKTIFIIKPGQVKLNLIPSLAPIGISACRVNKNIVEITYEGLGGGGVSAAYGRGLAKGVINTKTLQEGGGGKLGKGQITLPQYRFLLIGVDDTDNKEAGATYALVHNIAERINKDKNIRYLTHGNIQLYPINPHKTGSCFSTVVGFIYRYQENKEKIIQTFISLLKKYTLSNQTAMAIYEGFILPKALVKLSKTLKANFFDDINHIKHIAKDSGVEVYPITGERGIIGAVGALGLYDNPELASGLPKKFLRNKSTK